MSANQGVTQLDGASEPAREAPRMDNRFRARCASALMHPATVTAVALLLLNDLVFKSVWPGSWATGKLSDLAWVVFASPLLAFLLSFLVRRSTVGQRVAFIASYAALPLLYAAFNTFGPAHDLIIRGLSIASGGTSGSPLDVTDSLVIPFGLGIALWVWRRRIASTESLRMRLAVLTAGVAALASVATSESQPDFGMRDVGTSRDGAIHAGAWELGHFRSEDGGLSWRGGSVDSGQIEWGGESVDTPTGRYVIQGPDIVRFGSDGRSKLVFSTAYMQEEGNVWVQEHATSHLDARELTTAPRSIVYHEPSGNLIMAMGIQGVLVGTADGEWTRYAVGRYSPVDFSFLGKTGLLLSNGDSLPYDTTLLSDESHTITAAIELSDGGTDVASATFTVDNNGPALVFSPEAMAFSVDEGGTGTGSAGLDTNDGTVADYTLAEDVSWLTVSPLTSSTPPDAYVVSGCDRAGVRDLYGGGNRLRRWLPIGESARDPRRW